MANPTYDVSNSSETLFQNNDSTFFIPDSIVQDSIINYFYIYPNPSPGIFTLTVTDPGNNAELSVFNILGETVYKARITKPATTIDMSSHPKGIYFAKLTGGDEIHTFKIVCQ